MSPDAINLMPVNLTWSLATLVSFEVQFWTVPCSQSGASILSSAGDGLLRVGSTVGKACVVIHNFHEVFIADPCILTIPIYIL